VEGFDSEGRSRRPYHSGIQIKWNRVVQISTQQVGQGKNVDIHEAGANRCFAGAGRVPRQANAGSKLCSVGFRYMGCRMVICASHRLREIGCQAVRLTQGGRRLVTHSEVDAEIGAGAGSRPGRTNRKSSRECPGKNLYRVRGGTEQRRHVCQKVLIELNCQSPRGLCPTSMLSRMARR